MTIEYRRIQVLVCITCTIVLQGLFSQIAIAQQPVSEYRVGVASIDITPNYPIRQNGFLVRKQESEGVRQRIWAKALAISSSDPNSLPGVLITVDNLGIPDAITQEVARAIHKKCGMPLDHLSIAASHTHSAPMINGCAPNIFGMPIPATDQAHIDQYTSEFTNKLIEVATKAIQNRKPATLHYEIGSVGFAKNRRNASGPIDHDLPILVVRDLESKVVAIHASYACHCVTLSDNWISGDWAGYAQEHIERAHPGATALISIGCGADQNPQSGVTGNRFEVASQQGLEIANEVDRVIAGPLKPISGPLAIKQNRIDLALDTLPTRDQLEVTAKLDTPVGYHALVQLQKLDRGENLRTKIDYPVQTWAFGDSLAIVFLAGEVVVDYAKRLKSELDSQRIWLCAYSNAAPCYVPSERVLKEGGYEGAGAMIYYDQPTKFASGLEEKIISEVKSQLGDAFQPDAQPGKTLGILPKSPVQSVQSIQVPEGLRVELVASEPLLESPVAVNFGNDGRAWVAEMYDYPTGLDGRFQPGGRVRVLESSKRDGTFDRSTVFLDSIPFPTGVTPWRNGVLVCAAPDILYAEDTDGDQKADIVKKLYSGFGTENYQARVNSLEIGLDGWLEGSCGLFGGTIVSQGLLPGNETVRETKLGNRDFRIQPDLGLIEPATGRTQQGRVRDDWGNWFGCSNSSYGFHLPLDLHYISRNPYLAAPPSESSLAIDAEANKSYPATDKVQLFSLSGTGGQATAACGIGVYRDKLFGSEYENSVFTCESVNLVVHRLKLKPFQSTFRGSRGENESRREFLSSSDTWVRPVQARTAPDGSMWVVDMYRFVIEHPHWIPEADLAKIDVRAGHSMGRIYRVRSNLVGLRPWFQLNRLELTELVAAIDSDNGWQRDMAMQTLVWNGAKDAIPLLRELFRTSARPEARLQALCTIDQLHPASEDDLELALNDNHPGVRRHAVRLCDSLPKRPSSSSSRILSRIIELAADEDAQVRMQVAYSLGEWSDESATRVLLDLAITHRDDPFLVNAALSSLNRNTIQTFVRMLVLKVSRASPISDLVKRVVPSALALGDIETEKALLSYAVASKREDASDVDWSLIATILDSKDKQGALSKSSFSSESDESLNQVLTKGRALCLNSVIDEKVRLKVIGALARRLVDWQVDFAVLKELLKPKNSASIQMSAATAIARISGESTAKELLTGWRSYSPAMKAHVLDLLLGRDNWIAILLDELEAGTVSAADLNATRRQRLLTHAVSEIVTRSEKLLAGKVNSNRKAVIDDYRESLQLTGNTERGKGIFSKTCSTCHRLGDLGYAVGPDLTAVASKSHEFLLQEIFDPNRNLDNRYIAYQAITDASRVVSGVLLAETQSNITLRGPDAKDEALIRSEIEELVSNRLSLMPEGLEKVLSKQDTADILSYLDTWRGNRNTIAGNTPEEVAIQGGMAVLPANKAEIFGSAITFEPSYQNIGTWHGKDDYVAWNLELSDGSTFDVWIDWACQAGSDGNSFVLECGDQQISGLAESTITWTNYLQKKVGTMRLKSGKQRFTMRPGVEDLKGALLDLRTIYLVPAGQPLRIAELALSKTDNNKESRKMNTIDLNEIAAKILDDSQSDDARMEMIKTNLVRASELIVAMTKDMPQNETEEYRRIPWIWRVAIAVGKQNDTQVLRELLRVSLPMPGQPLRDWQSVVIGGGIINGLSLAGNWPKTRIKEIMKNEADLMTRWARCIELASIMADDEKVRTGTRYDALRIIPMDPNAQHLEQLHKYLSSKVDGELQMGAVSGLSDVELPIAANWLKENMSQYNQENRRLAIEAFVRNDDRLAALLDLIATGTIKREEVSASTMEKLKQTKNPSLKSKAESVLK